MADHDHPEGTTIDPDDQRLLADLAAALDAAEPISERHRVMAKGLLAWRTIDADLAAISADTAIDELAGVRSGLATRTVTFAAGESVVEVTVADRVTSTLGVVRLTLDGQVVPADGAVPIVVRHRDGETAVDTDEFGTFRVDGIIAGPVRLMVRFPAGDIVTEAVVL